MLDLRLWGGVVGLIMYKRKPVTLDALNDKTTIYINDIKNRTQQEYVAHINVMIENGDIQRYINQSETVEQRFSRVFYDYSRTDAFNDDCENDEMYSAIFNYTTKNSVSERDKKQILFHKVYTNFLSVYYLD